MLADPLRLYIGWDDREAVAYHTLCHSIITRASGPVSITPIRRDHIKAAFTRARVVGESTDFSISRFLTPWLAEYKGIAVFMDCDFLCRTDIYGLLDEVAAQPTCPVLVCKHNYTPRAKVKFLGNRQEAYPCKNWSSLMVFNLQHWDCKNLTPEYVNAAPAADLHRFKWVRDHGNIGRLSLVWNWLVGEYAYNPDAKMVHFTEGGPWFPGYEDCDYADEWRWEANFLVDTAPQPVVV